MQWGKVLILIFGFFLEAQIRNSSFFVRLKSGTPNEASQKCLGVPEARQGVQVCQFSPMNVNTQKWIVQPVGDNYYTFVMEGTNLCLDAQGNAKENGTILWLWERNESLTQKFRLMKTPSGAFAIRTALDETPRAIDIPCGQKDDGIIAQLWQVHDGLNQRFFLQQDERDGCYSIINLDCNKCLGVHAEPHPGQDVCQYAFSNPQTQNWIVTSIQNDPNYFRFELKGTGLFLTARNSGRSNGTKLELSPIKDGDSQRFKLRSLTFRSSEDLPQLTEFFRQAQERRYCSGVDIPEGTQEIVAGHFHGRRNVKCLRIPISVVNIASNALCNCHHLHTVK
jgi:hypothetical protein